MKSLFKLLIFSFIVSLAFASCEDEKGGNDNNDDNKSEFSGPGVKTLDAQNVTETKATLYGILNAPDQVALDFEFGFEVSMESVFTNESTKKYKSKYYDEKHGFTCQLEHLRPDTVYYYRAYMLNQMLLYRGEIKSFTTNDIELSSGEISNLTRYSATITAKVNAEEEVSSYGIYYSTSENPAQGDSMVVGTDRFPDGSYSCQLSELARSTTYYYCTYAKLEDYIKTGPVKSLTTNDIELSDGEVIHLTCYSAVISAKVSSDDEVSSYGICYSTNNDPIHKGNRVSGASKDADGSFACQLRRLEGATTYYYCTYAYSHEGEPWKTGPVNSFTTKEDDVVETGDVDLNTLQVKSRLTIVDGTYNTLTMGVCYSTTNETPTIIDQNYTVNEVDADNTYITALTSIPFDVKVYYRAYILIDGVVHYGNIKSFIVGRECDMEHTYVDLGLSVNWATFNVGARKPEDNGAYYAWGETETKSNYAWDTYKWCRRSAGSLIKYCTSYSYGAVDNKTVLESEDDVAHVKWGGDWRMPTKEEYDELLNSCTWTRTSQNGVKGYQVTSNKAGFTDCSIFLPAAGCCYDTSLYYVGLRSFYWSSSLHVSFPEYAYYLYFHSEDLDMRYNDRYSGHSVRPVCPSESWLESLSISLSEESLNIIPGKTFKITATISVRDEIVKQNAMWKSDNPSIVTVDNNGLVSAVSKGTATITALYEGKSASCVVNVVDEPDIDHSFVDLGLSVKWASFNVGAISPEDYGDYYAWGEIEKKDYYYWDIYKWCKTLYGSIDIISLTKYNNGREQGVVDKKNILDLSDDVSNIIWGGQWRIPTKEEYGELLNSCTWTWTTQNGVNGYLVTSNKVGYTDHSIFLPATGIYGTQLEYVGKAAYYWTSSLDVDIPKCAWSFHVRVDDHDHSLDVAWRCYGGSVRPVCP